MWSKNLSPGSMAYFRYPINMKIIKSPSVFIEAFNEQDKRLPRQPPLWFYPDDATQLLIPGPLRIWSPTKQIRPPPVKLIVTNWQFVLSGRRPLALGENHHTIFLAGGQVLNRSMCTVGGSGKDILSRSRPDKVFISFPRYFKWFKSGYFLKYWSRCKAGYDFRIHRTQVILSLPVKFSQKYECFYLWECLWVLHYPQHIPSLPAEILEQIASIIFTLSGKDDPNPWRVCLGQKLTGKAERH